MDSLRCPRARVTSSETFYRHPAACRPLDVRAFVSAKWLPIFQMYHFQYILHIHWRRCRPRGVYVGRTIDALKWPPEAEVDSLDRRIRSSFFRVASERHHVTSYSVPVVWYLMNIHWVSIERNKGAAAQRCDTSWTNRLSVCLSVCHPALALSLLHAHGAWPPVGLHGPRRWPPCPPPPTPPC